MLMRYTFHDYEQIIPEIPDATLLTTEAINNFEELYKLVDEYVATLPPLTTNEYTNYDKRKQRKHYKHGRKHDNQTSWSQPSNFKATTMEKKEGIDAIYNDLRSILNKITLKNRDSLLPKIMEIVHLIMNDECEYDEEGESNDEQDSYVRIIQLLLDIIKKMNGGHEIYVIVLKEMIQCYPSFITQMNESITTYKKSYDRIVDIDANHDYDGYCELVKHNDYRRSTSKFIVHLTEYNLLHADELAAMIEKLFETVMLNIDIESKTVLIEEVTENLFLFMIHSYPFLKSHQKWETLIEKLNECSKLKARDHKSISSRIVFKYMDIQDALKKCNNV